jgi:glycosyltransferase involved in cell wall biosynthesis
VAQNNILVITHWGYEEGLIQSYTLPYFRIIHSITPSSKIFLVTYEKNGLEKDKDKRKAISRQLEKDNIYLLPEKYRRAGLSKYFFTCLNLFFHLRIIFTKKIRSIHSFCTPAGSYAWMLSKLTGKKLVIDSYEPHSEYMKDSGTWSEKSFAYKFLRAMEKKQAKRADYLIVTTPGMVSYTENRFNIKLKNSFVKPACVDLEKFDYKPQEAIQIRNELNLREKIVGVYAGKFGDFYLKEEIFELFQTAFSYWGNRLHILLLSDMKEDELKKYCRQYDLRYEQFSLINVPHERMPGYLSVADFAISPYRPAPSKKFCTPIKNGEYWAIGLPVIITKDISVDSDIIRQNDVGYVLQELTPGEYKNAVLKIDQLLQTNKTSLRYRIRNIAIQNRTFAIAEEIYKHIYQ